MNSALDWIRHLGLQPHPEGGYFRETYRATESIAHQHLPERFAGSRSFSTAIYFLLEAGQCSAFHRIRSDEAWHLYAGGPLEIYAITPTGELIRHRLGLDLTQGEQPQRVIPADHWFASRPAPGVSYALVGCTVAPGFDFSDFEMGSRPDLLRQFPTHAALIRELTQP